MIRMLSSGRNAPTLPAGHPFFRLCRPAAFPFFYIEPWKKEYLPITAKFLGPISRVEAEKIAPIGELCPL